MSEIWTCQVSPLGVCIKLGKKQRESEAGSVYGEHKMTIIVFLDEFELVNLSAALQEIA